MKLRTLDEADNEVARWRYFRQSFIDNSALAFASKRAACSRIR